MWYCLKCRKMSMNIYLIDRSYVLMEDGRYLKRARNWLGYGNITSNIDKDKRNCSKIHRLDCDCGGLSCHEYIPVHYRDFIRKFSDFKEEEKTISLYKHIDIKTEDVETIYNDIREQMLDIRKRMKTEGILNKMVSGE
jgi:hypothetical protein